MEKNTKAEKSSGQEDNSSAIFGTSSDAIIEGLHKGAFKEPGDAINERNPGDSLKIVNEQEQNEIVNPDEEEFSEKAAGEFANPSTAKENQGIADDVIEGDVIDDETTEDEILKEGI